MAIDFTLSPEHEEIRKRVRAFIQGTVVPAMAEVGEGERDAYLRAIFHLRSLAKAEGLWLPHMPKEWGGMGLGHVELAMVQSEAAKTRIGPWVLNCQAPDEGNMHTLLHWADDEQKEKYLRPLLDGVQMSCFAMTEPEVAGSDPTLIRTEAVQDGDEWVINGHKWFISNARRASFAILIARTEQDVPEGSRGPTPRSSSTCPIRAGTTCARSRPCTAPPATARSSSPTCACPAAPFSGVGATGTAWASTGSARPAWPTACAGSRRRRRPWT